MTKQEFDKLYVGKKKVVHCTTEELAEEFLKEAHRHGYKWINGRSYLEYNKWKIEKEETCYELFDGSYADVDFYTREGYEIIEFKGFKEEKMSYIEQVAHMLGVEIGEEFEIEGSSYNPFHFEEGGLYDKDDYQRVGPLSDLIVGKLKIKKQWKPKIGEKYWFVDLALNNGIKSYLWDNLKFENILLKHGAVYKTKEEAEQAFKKVLKALKNE